MLREAVTDPSAQALDSVDGAAPDRHPRPAPQHMHQGSPEFSRSLTYARTVSGPPRLQAALKLSIIMATFNEEQTIIEAINEVLAVDFPCEIELIVVDDGSSDKTAELLAGVDDSRLIVSRHATNSGKGAALLTGVALATGTHLIPFDADLEYVAADITRMLEPVLRGRCSVVYGVRLFGYNTVYRNFWYAIGNRMLTRITNILYGSCLSDLHTCLKLIPIGLMRTLNLTESRFGLDTEITVALLRRGIRPFEVPVSYYSRVHAEGKKIRWHDAVACLWILLRVRFGRAYSRRHAALVAIDDHAQSAARTAKSRALTETDDDRAVPATG